MTSNVPVDLKVKHWLNAQISIAPLVSFRILFGLLMIFSIARFYSNNWIEELYILPKVHFSYFHLDFIQSLPNNGMYWIFALMGLSAVAIALGLFYRVATILFFILFTYVELIDKATYLNHYYFVSLIAFLLILVPANRAFSLDTKFGFVSPLKTVPRWTIFIFQLQLAAVYFFAGLAKLHPDWWLRAMPMSIWLPARQSFPLIGPLFNLKATAYVFSFFGLFYDLLIPIFLWWKKARPFAYVAVIVFHLMTWALFQIGVFPWVMIACTLIFFSGKWHEKFIPLQAKSNLLWNKSFKTIIIPFFILQVFLPLRFLMFDSDLYWKEQGYRFSWRVMLMEKAGSITFYIENMDTNKKSIFNHQDHLTQLQETQMSTQPDMILQMAKYIEQECTKAGLTNVAVYAESYVTLNGSGSKPFTKKDINLLSLKNGSFNRNWIHDWED